jgi:RimJ/RimL family protein N-acetyltransferase
MNQTFAESSRLVIRYFRMEDLSTIHRILDQAFGEGNKAADPDALAERRSWMQWTLLSQEWYAKLHQPPYGDRAIILKATGELIGSIGYVPQLDAFAQIPELTEDGLEHSFFIPGFGLFWAIDPARQRQGYATEAANAMIDHAFNHLRLKQIFATTEYSNEASRGVMRKVGMKITRNPLPYPPWLQVVGVLRNKAFMLDMTSLIPPKKS